MVWNYNYNQEEKELVYDLRQAYAGILTKLLEQIAECRDENDFKKWYMALENLHVEIWQKLTDTEREDYKKELKKCLQEINKYPDAFRGDDKDPTSVTYVRNAMIELEKWIRVKMEKHNMFGAKEEPELL